MQFNIIYIMRTKVSLGGIYRFLLMGYSHADAPPSYPVKLSDSGSSYLSHVTVLLRVHCFQIVVSDFCLIDPRRKFLMVFFPFAVSVGKIACMFLQDQGYFEELFCDINNSVIPRRWLHASFGHALGTDD